MESSHAARLHSMNNLDHQGATISKGTISLEVIPLPVLLTLKGPYEQ